MPDFTQASTALDEGRYDEALVIVLSSFERIDRGEGVRPRLFFTMFLWTVLVERHPPAREAMVHARDVQLQRVLTGDDQLAPADERPAQSRADLVIDMNQTLGDLRSSYAMFIALREHQSALARRIASLAMPAILDAGDFVLAEQLAPDPMRQLAAINMNAEHLPLLPPGRQAPRLAAELWTFAQQTRERAQALRGLGRVTEADALRQAALQGLANDEMREMAKAELDEAGAINRILGEHQEKNWPRRPDPDA